MYIILEVNGSEGCSVEILATFEQPFCINFVINENIIMELKCCQLQIKVEDEARSQLCKRYTSFFKVKV